MASEYQKLSRPPLQDLLSKIAKKSGGAWDNGPPEMGNKMTTDMQRPMTAIERYDQEQHGIIDDRGHGPTVLGGGSGMHENESVTPNEIAQLAQYLYSLGENVEYLNENGGGSDPDPDPGGGDDPSPPGDIDPALLRDLSGSTLFPFTYGLLYDNRNEFSARTSGGGAWVAEAAGATQPLEREAALDFSVPV